MKLGSTLASPACQHVALRATCQLVSHAECGSLLWRLKCDRVGTGHQSKL